MHELIFIRALRFLDCRRLLSTLIKFGTRTKPIASEAVDTDEVFDVIEKERSNRRLDRNSFHDGPFQARARALASRPHAALGGTLVAPVSSKRLIPARPEQDSSFKRNCVGRRPPGRLHAIALTFPEI